jgi:DNA (cytosine-5)-methyltransferase 1
MRTFRPTFIDLFAGCGGFSLGFSMAGWQGLFAVEKNESAFGTFSANFLAAGGRNAFDWPSWLPSAAMDVRWVLKEHRHHLESLRGKVAAVIGGPPCQGFSFAGARSAGDSRNQLFTAYVEFVSIVRPRFVLIENVRGITIEHGKKLRDKKGGPGRRSLSYSERIVSALGAIGYRAAEPRIVLASDFGVPQRRPRVFFFAELEQGTAHSQNDLFAELYALREDFLSARRLPIDRPVHVREAISDLLESHGKQPCADPESPNGFWQGLYGASEYALQRLLRNGHRVGSAADSHRFVNHREATRKRFRTIRSQCRSGVQLNTEDRNALSISKHVVVPLRGDQVGHTLTTLPDDYIHYREPRILTPREYARLQTFPDEFLLCGPYTTGGERRKRECPRYTQVGNAVPPLLAEAIGEALRRIVERNQSTRTPNGFRP